MDYTYWLTEGMGIRSGRKRKLYAYFLSKGIEIPHSHITKNGLAMPATNGASFTDPISGLVVPTMKTGMPVLKIFVSEEQDGIKQFYSFYVRFKNPEYTENMKIVTIRPFCRDGRLMFRGMFEFLKKDEALGYMDKTSVSASFLIRQRTLPIQVLKNMITVETPIVRNKRIIRKLT